MQVEPLDKHFHYYGDKTHPYAKKNHCSVVIIAALAIGNVDSSTRV